MNFRVRLVVSIAAPLLLLLATVAVIFRVRAEPGTSRAEIAGLAEAGRLDDAESKLALLLRSDPRNPGTNLLAAQVAMARSEPVTNSGMGSDPGPAIKALEYLGRVETRDEKLAAIARLWRGKAERYLGRLDEAEESWLESLRLDPAVPEAGWLLLQEYYLQARSDEFRSLSLQLHRGESDPRDRALLLLEPLRQEVMPPAPASLVLWFDPIASRHPNGLRANIALGLALVRSSQSDPGMNLLRKVVELHPERRESWEALMTGLEETSDVEELPIVLKSLPGIFSSSPWIVKYQARIDEDGGNWRAAASGYRRALESSIADPRLEYRLARCLRRIGEQAEADRLDRQHQVREAMGREAKDLYEVAISDKSFGFAPNPELYAKLACLREKMGYPEQAKAWHQLAEFVPTPR